MTSNQGVFQWSLWRRWHDSFYQKGQHLWHSQFQSNPQVKTHAKSKDKVGWGIYFVVGWGLVNSSIFSLRFHARLVGGGVLYGLHTATTLPLGHGWWRHLFAMVWNRLKESKKQPILKMDTVAIRFQLPIGNGFSLGFQLMASNPWRMSGGILDDLWPEERTTCLVF